MWDLIGDVVLVLRGAWAAVVLCILVAMGAVYVAIGNTAGRLIGIGFLVFCLPFARRVWREHFADPS